MDLASEEAAPATASTNIYVFDLVTHEPPKEFNLGGLGDRGQVTTLNATSGNIYVPVTVSRLKLLRVDCGLVNVNAGAVSVVDRSYMQPGMVVGSASDLGGGQAGVVTGATTLLDLVRLDDNECPAGPVIRGVPTWTPGLRRVRRLNLGDFVVSGPWLGWVVELSVDVDVLLRDGTVRRFADAESKKQILEAPEHKYTANYRGETGRYYPGQHVSGNPSASLKPYRFHNGIVVKVEMSGVLVHWVASAHCGTDEDLVMASAPPAYQHPHDLTYFCSSSCPWMVSDRCFLGAPAAETKKKSYLKQQRKLFFERHRRRLDQFERPMSVSNTRTTVDVLWQDGTRQRGVPSTSLTPFAITNANEFFPGEFVVGGDHDDDGSATTDATTTTGRRVGIVRSMNSKDQTVRVSWFKASSLRPGGEDGSSGEVECGDDTVSAYDLRRRYPWSSVHPFYGDIVVRRLPSVPNNGESTTPAAQQPADLSWVGHVVDIPDGKVLVNWGDGSTSTVLLHEVCVVSEEHYSELLTEIGEWVDGGVDAPPPELAGAHWQNQPAVDSSNVYGGGSAMEATDNNDATSVDAPEEEGEKKATDSTAFPRFDVVHSHSDHHYVDSMDKSGNGGKKWIKAVQKEWKILANDLPDTIYVRAFEDRMDLVRAVMVGASGTPYHDGLFFFDMQLPPSYPAAPPQVYYHSFGLQINPNLYPSGTVCLSLLNTFGGKGTEVWSPASSSLVQVLVSIQGLVLNDDPYYNEAGYEALVGKPEGRRNALPYAENAYLLSLRSALHLLRRPPQGFEEFVRDHFRRRGRFMLRACKAYLHGCAVGTLTDEARVTEGGMERRCSNGLRLALTNMVPSLVAAFKEIDAEGCDEFQFQDLL